MLNLLSILYYCFHYLWSIDTNVVESKAETNHIDCIAEKVKKQYPAENRESKILATVLAGTGRAIPFNFTSLLKTARAALYLLLYFDLHFINLPRRGFFLLPAFRMLY